MVDSRIVLMVAAVAALMAAAGCSGKPVEIVETRTAFTTEVTVRVIAPSEAAARRALALAWTEMESCERLLDRHRGPSEAYIQNVPGARTDPLLRPSDVWRMNQDAGKWNTEVDPVTISCLAAAKEVWEYSGGAFDPTVGPLIDLWRKAAQDDRIPTDEQIVAARAKVGMDKVEILVAAIQKGPGGEGWKNAADGAAASRVMHSVGLAEGMSIDLGGIAKGYVAGRMAHRLREGGAIAGLVAVAGDIYAFGERPAAAVAPGADRRWTVGVQDPRFPEDRTRLFTAIRIRDQATDTSGHYYRGFTIQDRRFSHIVDPRTGRPVDVHLASVTVVAPDPALTDGLSTAISVMGVKAGLEMVEKLSGVECLLIEVPPETPITESGAPPADAPLTVHRSSGFAALEVPAAPDAPGKPGG